MSVVKHAGRTALGSQNRLMVGLVGLTVLGVASSAYTLAVFTDQDATGADTIDAGRIQLDATKVAAFDISASNMVPGDEYYAGVVIEHLNETDAALTNGFAESDLRYSVDYAITNSVDGVDPDGAAGGKLEDVVTWEVKTMSAATACNDTNWGAATAVIGADEVSARDGAGNFIGDKAQGADAGDRTLADGASEKLCFHVVFPDNSAGSYDPQSQDNTYQGAKFDVELTVSAEQVRNNA